MKSEVSSGLKTRMEASATVGKHMSCLGGRP